jgi:urease accessory protein
LGGLAHPALGPDHVVAMVAVGLWGAFLGPPAIVMLPIVFPLVMAGGGVLGILGVPLPGVELGIAVSAIVLGLMVAFAAKPNLWIAAVLVGAFGCRAARRTCRSCPQPRSRPATAAARFCPSPAP